MTWPSLLDKSEVEQETESHVQILWCFIIPSVLLNIRDYLCRRWFHIKYICLSSRWNQEIMNFYWIFQRLRQILCPVSLTWFRRTSDWSFGRSDVRWKEVGAARFFASDVLNLKDPYKQKWSVQESRLSCWSKQEMCTVQCTDIQAVDVAWNWLCHELHFSWALLLLGMRCSQVCFLHG